MSCDDSIGLMNWLVVPVKDMARAQKFYAEIFLWESAPEVVPDKRPGSDGMCFFSRSNKLHGAFHIAQEGFHVANHKANAAHALPVLPTFHVKECNETLKKVESLGGSMQLEKTEIGNDMGFYARFIDTEGNMMAIWSQE